jgi:hypothetical protein
VQPATAAESPMTAEETHAIGADAYVYLYLLIPFRRVLSALA